MASFRKVEGAGDKVARSVMMSIVKTNPVVVLVVPAFVQEGNGLVWTGSYRIHTLGFNTEQPGKVVATILGQVAIDIGEQGDD